MKIAFLYGGQGSQVPAMGKELYSNYPEISSFYDSIELDFPLKEYSFEGELDLISQTEWTQPIMVAFQIAVTKILKDKGIEPDIVLGLSLGEYGALYGAGVLTADEILKLVRYRGLQMAQASKNIKSLMLAVLTDDLDYLEKLCQEVSSEGGIVQVSNLNTKGQIVISGEEKAVSKVGEILNEENIRAIPLKTSGAFHTSYMDEVCNQLEGVLKTIEFKKPRVPIIHNLYGRYREDVDIREALSKQVNNKVLFKDSLEGLMDSHVDLYIEIGHGSVIKGFMKRLNKKIKPYEVNSIETIDELLKEVGYCG
ncbi:MAG TPA: ACP S-malonyltransferase [Tissierellaceae bacterium]|nr:ACP S-malonyltransferase [Tissierellaceae bacterium]